MKSWQADFTFERIKKKRKYLYFRRIDTVRRTECPSALSARFPLRIRRY